MADRHELERGSRERQRTAAERVDGLVTGAGKAAGWLLRAGWSVTKRLPGGDIAERQLHRLEDAAMAEVRKRLNGQVQQMTNSTAQDEAIDGEPVEVTSLEPHNDPLRAVMAALLNRSVSQSRRGAQDYLFANILRQLTPDEARVVAALSDGTAYPLVHVAARGAVGGAQRIVLVNASTVGRASGVALPEQTPIYVSRLIGLGLVEVGDEDPALQTEYDILLTEDYVRAAEQRAKRVKFLRHTVRLSGFGRRFWQACDPSIQQLPRSPE